MRFYKNSNAYVITALIAIASGFCANALGFPLPWMLGPMFGVMIYTAIGSAAITPQGWLPVLRSILGVAIGANFTPTIVNRMGEIGIGLAVLPFCSLSIIVIGYFLFRRIAGYDRATALFGAMPGGLIDMVTIGSQMGGNIRTLTLIHTMRIMIVITTASFLVVFSTEIEQKFATPELFTPLHQLPMVMVLGLAGWGIGHFLRLPGASITGPMALSATMHGFGLVSASPIYFLVILAQIGIGASLGEKFRNVTAAELAGPILSGAIFTVISFAPVFGFAFWVSQYTSVGKLNVLLAYAPGGQAEMNILTIAIGADVVYVAVHHIARVFIVLFSLPLLRKFIERKANVFF